MISVQPCLRLFTLTCLIFALAGNTWSQTFPSKVVRYIVPEGAGSGADVIARVVAAELTQIYGQQVIVDNRAGAGGNIGAEMAAKAPADGYTWLEIATSMAANVSLYRNLQYDLVRDFAPVTQLTWFPQVVVVHPSFPVKSVADLIKLAKAKPGGINYGSAGTGSSTFMAGEYFKGLAGVDMVHVPYKGGGAALAAVVAGEVPVYFSPVVTALPQIRQGRLRALAVTSQKRWPMMPELPTIAEQGVAGYEASTWHGLVVPAKTPKEIVATILRTTVGVLKNPNINKRLTDLGFIPVGSEPDEFGAYIKSEITKQAQILQRAGVSPE
jgi:tripartite-type tricarboxylate transporter receptor subunit TctC